MRNWIKLVILSLILACLLNLAASSGAQEGLSVVVNEYDYTFAESIYFHLVAKSPKYVEKVFLIYKLGDSPILHKQAPDFNPGTHIEVEWTWNLEPGDLPPGLLVKYYWRLIAKDGTVYKTDPVSFRYEDTRFSWHSLSEGPVTLRWYKGSEEFARDLLDAATKALTRLQEEMGVKVEGPINIYVYASRKDMQPVIPSRSKLYDEFTITLGMVLSKDTLVILGSDPDVDKTIAHELSHLVVGKATENPLGAPLPRWLDEGLAMYAEGELPPANRLALERAIQNGELISVRSLSGYVGDPAKVDLFYAEAYSLVEFLIKEYGKDKMTELLEKFAEGTYQEDALQEVYGFGLDELDARWKAYLGVPVEKPGGGERITPVVGRPPKERKPGFCAGSPLLTGGLITASWLLSRRRRIRKYEEDKNGGGNQILRDG